MAAHPDRVFSALVCAWAERGEDETERAALEWLEALEAPAITAPCGMPRQVVSVFVPPNDMTVSGKPGAGLPKDAGSSLAVLPALRRNRQPRQFPAIVLPQDQRCVWLTWPADEAGVACHRSALTALAARVAYLGHSSSLVRLAIRVGADGPEPTHVPDRGGELRLRLPGRGRLASLVAGYASVSNGRPWRPPRSPARAYGTAIGPRCELPRSLFGRDWIVLADAGGEAPGSRPLRSSPGGCATHS